MFEYLNCKRKVKIDIKYHWFLLLSNLYNIAFLNAGACKTINWLICLFFYIQITGLNRVILTAHQFGVSTDRLALWYYGDKLKAIMTANKKKPWPGSEAIVISLHTMLYTVCCVLFFALWNLHLLNILPIFKMVWDTLQYLRNYSKFWLHQFFINFQNL